MCCFGSAKLMIMLFTHIHFFTCERRVTFTFKYIFLLYTFFKDISNLFSYINYKIYNSGDSTIYYKAFAMYSECIKHLSKYSSIIFIIHVNIMWDEHVWQNSRAHSRHKCGHSLTGSHLQDSNWMLVVRITLNTRSNHSRLLLTAYSLNEKMYSLSSGQGWA